MEFLFERSEQEKSTLLMNEIKGSTLGRIKIVKCAGSLKTKTCVGSLQKKKIGPSFQYTKFSVIELVLTKKKRNLSGTRRKLACCKSLSCWFSSSAARNTITKAIEYVTFGFSFRILVFFPF